MAETNGNGNVVISKKMLITLVLAVFIPFGVWAFDVFFGSKDAQVVWVKEKWSEDKKWYDKELLRLERQQADSYNKIENRTEALMVLTQQLSVEVKILTGGSEQIEGRTMKIKEWQLAVVSGFILLAAGLYASKQQADDFEIKYWTQIVSDQKILAVDSLVQLFILAPECMPMETTSAGFPRFALGGRSKFVDEKGRGWLIECSVSWDAKAQTKKNGSESVHIYPQDFRSILIFEPIESNK